MNQFAFHHDGGHGWLQVPNRLLSDLAIENFISRFSYIKGDQVYLEEDMDASLFITAWKAEKGSNPQWFDYFEDGMSKIRDFDRFPARADRSFSQVQRKLTDLRQGL